MNPRTHSAPRGPHASRRLYRRRGARASERGLTLIEIAIALLIVGLLAYMAVPSIEAISGVKAREEAGRISGAIRALYGQSALAGKVCRLVFDMDNRAYWPECTEGRFTVEREKERSRNGQKVEEKRPERMREPKDEVEALKQKIEKKAEFTPLESEDIAKRALPDGAELAVWVSHQRERYTKGTAYLYFFPQGHTERAHVYVSNGNGTVYTLVVSPLNGKVRVVDEELEDPRE